MLFIDTIETIISKLTKINIGSIELARGIELSCKGCDAICDTKNVMISSCGFSCPICLFPIILTASTIKT